MDSSILTTGKVTMHEVAPNPYSATATKAKVTLSKESAHAQFESDKQSAHNSDSENATMFIDSRSIRTLSLNQESSATITSVVTEESKTVTSSDKKRSDEYAESTQSSFTSRNTITDLSQCLMLLESFEKSAVYTAPSDAGRAAALVHSLNIAKESSDSTFFIKIISAQLRVIEAGSSAEKINAEIEFSGFNGMVQVLAPYETPKEASLFGLDYYTVVRHCLSILKRGVPSRDFNTIPLRETAIIRNCIDVLREFARSCQHSDSKANQRAKALIQSMGEALNSGDNTLCLQMITFELHRLNPNVSTTIQNSAREFADYPKMEIVFPDEKRFDKEDLSSLNRDSDSGNDNDDYIPLVNDLLSKTPIPENDIKCKHDNQQNRFLSPVFVLRDERLDFEGILRICMGRMKQIPDYKYVEPGVAIVHRIWLGKAIGEDYLHRIRSCDHALSRIWTHPRTGNKVIFHSILWTDPSTLSSPLPEGQRLEFRDYRELICGNKYRFASIVNAFIHHGEFALASDVLRFLALEKIGGLYMGVRWEPPLKDTLLRQQQAKFNPTVSSFRTFHGTPNPDCRFYDMPLRFDKHNEIIKHPITLAMKSNVDSEVMYSGSPHLPVLQSILFFLEKIFLPLGRQPASDVLRNYRKALQKTVSHPDQADDIRKKVHKDCFCNAPLLTNIIPLIYGLQRSGIHKESRIMCNPLTFRIPSMEWLEKKKNEHSLEMTNDLISVWDLPDEHRFEVWNSTRMNQSHITLPMLGIVRPAAQSWLRVPKSYRPEMEV